MISGEVYFLHPTNDWVFGHRQSRRHAGPPPPAPRGAARGQLPALRWRPDFAQLLRGAPGHALRAQVAGGASEAPAAGSHRRLQLHLPRQLAAAGRLPRRDPDLLCVAQRAHVLRGLQRPAAGLLPARGEGGEGRCVYILERPRLLLQERPKGTFFVKGLRFFIKGFGKKTSLKSDKFTSFSSVCVWHKQSLE